jgi:hypothetical protein
MKALLTIIAASLLVFASAGVVVSTAQIQKLHKDLTDQSDRMVALENEALYEHGLLTSFIELLKERGHR